MGSTVGATMTNPNSPATSIHLAGVRFETHEDSVTVHWLLGGMPHHRDVVFKLHTLDLQLIAYFEQANLSSMEIASYGEDTRDAHRPVDYQYNYSPEALAITLPTAHFDLKEEVFTMGLSVDGIPCGEWTGTIT